MGSLDTARCSMASHCVAGSAGGLGHRVPPRFPPVPSAKSRGPKLLSHWGAAPGTGRHQVLLAEPHRQTILFVGMVHASETPKQPSGTLGRVTCVPAQAAWHRWAPWLVSEGDLPHFPQGRGWLAGPTLTTSGPTEPVPHHVGVGSDGGWTGSCRRKGLCGKMLCTAGQKAWALLPCLGRPGHVSGRRQGWRWGEVP